MIIANELPAGAKIVQERLAMDLGISRTPLRTALQMLEAEQLVQSIPRRGVFVKSFSNQEIIDVFDCRIALECQAVILFSKRAEDQEIGKLRSLFTPFSNISMIDSNNYQKADSNFHNTIIEECGNDFLKRLFKQGNLILFMDRIGLIRNAEETLAEHFEIIDALEDGNAEQASLLMRRHLELSQELLIQNMNI